ncbi:Transducin beta-like protein 3 [Tetrabaena socialis]|uniref:Transducin beta-like protein 3 n=1 Tax=Tetrabaena socialis TaxID=47790 RepID=A0A2J8AF68_9CHLO|nr:Transducin beta-like protein 3 [Tetrabaena socialis]|eukprot:PNH11173.1 Transducin beta-like protein 3 [Tetrabaena socialis]
MALPDAVQDVERRLPAAAARLAGVPGTGGPLGAAEAEEVDTMLATLKAGLNDGDRATNSAADALLSEDGLRVPVLRLVAFAVRGAKRSDPPAYIVVAESTLSLCVALLGGRGSMAPPHWRAVALVAFARKLLRMDTLQSCSRAQSSGAARLTALVAGGAEAGAEGADLLHALNTSSRLVLGLLRLATEPVEAGESGRTERQLKEWRQLQLQFAGELAAALRDSHVFEHSARWALHVQLTESAGWLPQGAAVLPLRCVIAHFVYARDMAIALKVQGGARGLSLDEALSGPCVRHVALSLGVAALCAADGGASHGLPPELLLHLPLLGLDILPIVRGISGKQRLARSVLVSLTQVLEGSMVAAAAGPPRDWRLAAALLHRVRALHGDLGAGVGGGGWCGGLLAPAAPLAVAAALAGGLLPLWERLLRCAGRDPDCTEAALLGHLLTSPTNHAPFWDLLAYSDVREGAALVATWGKLLRTLVVPQLLWSMRLGGDSSRAAMAGAYVQKLLAAALDALEAVGLHDTDGMEASGPQLQLALLASYAVCDWLLPLARLGCEGMPLLQRTMLGRPASIRYITGSRLTVVTWLPMLARLCRTESAEGVGWRQLLLREVGAVSLLGATCQDALGTVAASGGVPSAWIFLLGSCCWLAAACPDEVRHAVLAAAAEAAAVAGSSSGRGGSGGSAGAGGGRRREGRGLSGRGDGAGPSRTAAPPPPGWSPQSFRAMEAELRGCPGNQAVAVGAVATALARRAELWVAGGSEDGAELVQAAAALGDQTLPEAVARAMLLSSPAGARALLRTCANPACDNLAGDSEAALPLRVCGRCGAAWYCRRECLAFHWRSGHREACTERGDAVAGMHQPKPVSEAPGASGLRCRWSHRFLVSVGSDKLIKVWDVAPVLQLLATTAAAAAAAAGDEAAAEPLSKKQKTAAAAAAAAAAAGGATANGPVALRTLAAVAGHDKDINAVAVAPNDQLVATASQDRTARVWSLPDLVQVVH